MVECYNDQTLIETMGVRRRFIDHAPGKSMVIKALAKGRARFGIVDADPGKSQPSELRTYEPFDKEGESIVLMKKKDTFICVLYPDLEGWMLNRARKNHLDPKEFGIPNSAKEMHKIPDLYERDGYKSLIRKLLEIDYEFRKVSEWMNEYGTPPRD